MKKMDNNTTVLLIILYINAKKRLSLLFTEGIDETYDKPLNCVFDWRCTLMINILILYDCLLFV